MIESLAGRAPTVVLVILAALLSVIDVASRAMAPLLARAGAARLRFLRLLEGPAFTVSPLVTILLLLALTATAAWAFGDQAQTSAGLAAAVGVARLKALEQQRKDLAAEGLKLAELGAARTADQSARMAAITAKDGELDTVTAEAEAVAKLIAAEKHAITAEDVRGGRDLRVDDVADALARTHAEAERAKRYAASRRLSIFAAEAGFDGPAPLGSFMQAVARAYSPAGKVPGGEKVDPRLFAAASGASSGVPGEGGFMVRPTWSDMLLQRGRESSRLLPRTTTIPIGEGSDSFEAPYMQQTDRSGASTRFGGVQVYRRAEAETVTASKIDQLKKFELKLEDMMGLAYVTGRLLRDVVALQAWIDNGFHSAFAFKADDELVRGTGSGQCLGALNANCLVTQAKETGQAADTFVAENALNMFARLHPSNIGGSVWYMNPALFPQLPKMAIAVGTGGFPVYMPPAGLSVAPYGFLLGRPVEPLEQCSAPGDVGDVLLADYGDMLAIEKGGVQTAESMHVRFIYDEMTYRFMYPLNAQPKEPAVRTPYKGGSTATLSAFVTLAAR